jgi:hypothetical protein
MLKYKTIYEVNAAGRRLARDRYGTRHWYGESEKNCETDRLTLFTFGEQAREDSENNLGHCLRVARQYDASLLVFKPQQIQIGGGRVFDPELAGTELFPVRWCKQYEDWVDTTIPQRPTTQSSEYGSSMEFWIYRNCFALPHHQGVYDVTTGKRLTNRREIIERIWDLGFATQRGRPPGIARIRWTGSRDELIEITELADRHWDRCRTSEAARKMVTPFRSINRYAAWPGSW